MNSSTTQRAAGVTIRVGDLEKFCIAALMKAGVSEPDARTTAAVLVTTDTWGVHTHGVKSLYPYIKRMQRGGLNPRAVPAVVAEGPAWARIDGQCAVAMVTSVKAMQLAIEKAWACGIAYTGVFNSCHFGAAGYYAAMAADAGMIGIAMANDVPSMASPGAKGRVIGNNPLAFAIPRQNGRPIVLDMALSTVAGGKVVAAETLHQKIPEGWLLDVSGQPTTDSSAFLKGGALTSMGGYKGYGMAVVVEALAGILPGARILTELCAWQVELATPTGHGAAFIALDIGKMMPLDAFYARVETMASTLHAAPVVGSTGRVLLPGEREMEVREKSTNSGIALPADVVANLHALCDDIQMDLNAYIHS